MTNYVKGSDVDNMRLTVKSITYIFHPAFYMIGIIKQLTDFILKRHNKCSNLQSEDLKDYLNFYPTNIDDFILEIEKIYQETLVDTNSLVTDCYTLRQVIMFLATIKNSGYTTLDSEYIIIVARMINDFARHDVVRRASLWYELHSEDPNKYWPYDYNISSNTFTLKYTKNRISGGQLFSVINTNDPNKEFYIIRSKNKMDSIKLTHTLKSNKVYISWQLANVTQQFGDIITDNLFYDLGGPLYRILYEQDERIYNDKVCISPYSKNINLLSKFIKLLESLSKPVHKTHRRLNSPWGMLYFNTLNIIDNKLVPPYTVCILKNKCVTNY